MFIRRTGIPKWIGNCQCRWTDLLQGWFAYIPCINLARTANLPEGLYILLAVISSFFSLFFFTMSKAISVSTGPIFTIFLPNGRYLREFYWYGPVFPISQGTLPRQPILCRKQNANHVRFLQFLNHMKAFWVQIIDLNFFQYLKGRCHGKQLKSKNWRFFTDQSTLSRCHSKMDCNIAITISKD